MKHAATEEKQFAIEEIGQETNTEKGSARQEGYPSQESLCTEEDPGLQEEGLGAT